MAKHAQLSSTEVDNLIISDLCCSLQVAEGATALYIEQLRGIQYVTDHGAQQLSVDIEYSSNVLSALSMTIPPTLATFHTCFQTPRDQLKERVKSDSGNQLDLPTAKLVCRMRRVNLECNHIRWAEDGGEVHCLLSCPVDFKDHW